ncbi:peptidoglycan recognition protein family protein [Clostridium tertium]|uniref:peptidoglycan recognition protein family protein n=1 Tax=Clostridium tertium TaxID=1559 RepID=UPI0022DF3C21|nr:N-acetylmuramoyl-L-alanine amidase [Clostridium tertium]
MALVQRLISSDKYSIKCPYSMTPKGICIHNTANDASASNEISYMQSNTNSVSFHIGIDDVEAIQGIPFNRNAWHAGDGSTGDGNRNYISVEICYSKSGGTRFINAEKRAAKEVAALLKQYGWGIAQIRKHQDFSGKYCPHRTLDMGWQRFLNMIQDELDTSNPPTNELYRVRKTWEDSASQIGAFSNLQNAKDCADANPGYSVFNSNGVKVYPVSTIVVGSKVRVTGTNYATGESIPDWVKQGTYTVSQITDNKALLKEISSWVYLKDLALA